MTAERRFYSMGCELVVGGATAAEAGPVSQLFMRRERMFSRFVPDSELNRVNQRSGRPTLVSSEFATMVELALEAAEATNGLVDPTLGRALRSAGYDRDFVALVDDPAPPGPAARSRLADLRLRGRVLELPAGVELDLNGVVKARTVDDALAVVRGGAFVSAGGDLAARGPLSVALPGGESVRLVSGALATSGVDRRRWRRGGTIQHHLIDPRSGRPARSPWETVTVCGLTCLGADVAAKAAFLLGSDGPGWLDQHRMPGRFRTSTGEVTLNQTWLRSLAEHACT